MSSRTRVVHVRQGDYTVYVGRGRCPKTGRSSRWGNPYRVREHGTDALRLYLAHLAANPELVRAARAELKGEVLGCWCKRRGDEVCHGDVLALLADGESLGAVRERIVHRLLAYETRDLFPEAP